MNPLSSFLATPQTRSPSLGLGVSTGIWTAGAALMLGVMQFDGVSMQAIIKVLLSCAWGALACLALWRLGERLTLGDGGGGALLFAAAVGCALAAHLAFDLALFRWIRDGAASAQIQSDRWYMALVMHLTVETKIFVHALLYGVFSAVALSLFWARELAHRERLLSEARLEAVQAQLAALRFQINPHFLFNTLNAIGSLIVTHRNDAAERMVERLAAFLRATLTDQAAGLVSLEQELGVTQAYLEIEAVRFPDRLAVAYDFSGDLRNAAVPSFILQPLIENAIKHGVAASTQPVTLTVTARAESEDLVLSVFDDGGAAAVGRSQPGMGLGLQNIRERLQLLFQGRAHFETGPVGSGYCSIVRLPLARVEQEGAECPLP